MTSVVIPVYNGVHVIPTSVPHVLAFAGVDEWLWVDDGSTDGTADLLADLLSSEPRARILPHGRNRGRAAARNTGAAAARGETLMFLDADVSPDPDLAERFRRTLASGAAATVARLIPTDFAADPYGEYLRRARRGVPVVAQPGDVLPWRLFVTAACAVHSEALRRAGGFDETVVYGEDLALACRLADEAPDGLRASGGTARIADTSTLERALTNIAAFGAALPEIEAVCPGVLRLAGLDQAVARGWRGTIGRSRAIAALVNRVIPYAPPFVQPDAVRYLLGHTLLRAYDDARLSPRPGR